LTEAASLLTAINKSLLGLALSASVLASAWVGKANADELYSLFATSENGPFETGLAATDTNTGSTRRIGSQEAHYYGLAVDR
jgi:hypothetical protein